MLFFDIKSEPLNSNKIIPNQLSKSVKPPNENATIFPTNVLLSMDKWIMPVQVINPLRTLYIKEKLATEVPLIFPGKRIVLKRPNILEQKLIATRPELKKMYSGVHNFNRILESVIKEISSDKDLRNKIINLKESKVLSAFSKLLALKLLQETFERLDEKDKINFKKEALRGSKFG